MCVALVVMLLLLGQCCLKVPSHNSLHMHPKMFACSASLGHNLKSWHVSSCVLMKQSKQTS